MIRGNDPEVPSERELRNQLGELAGPWIRCNPNALLQLVETDLAKFFTQEIAPSPQLLRNIEDYDAPLAVPAPLGRDVDEFYLEPPDQPLSFRRQVPSFAPAAYRGPDEVAPFKSPERIGKRTAVGVVAKLMVVGMRI